jgi:hypothetical protein
MGAAGSAGVAEGPQCLPSQVSPYQRCAYLLARAVAERAHAGGAAGIVGRRQALEVPLGLAQAGGSCMEGCGARGERNAC